MKISVDVLRCQILFWTTNKERNLFSISIKHHKNLNFSKFEIIFQNKSYNDINTQKQTNFNPK